MPLPPAAGASPLDLHIYDLTMVWASYAALTIAP